MTKGSIVPLETTETMCLLESLESTVLHGLTLFLSNLKYPSNLPINLSFRLSLALSPNRSFGLKQNTKDRLLVSKPLKKSIGNFFLTL